MLYTLLGALLLLLAALVVADKRRATIRRHRFIVRLHLLKALRDRNWRIWMPADEAAQAFGIKDVRTLRDPKDFNGKPGRHPALERKWRRK